MRSKRSAPSWLPSKEEIEREHERRYAVLLRGHLEELGRAEWPPWPEEEDPCYHAWVRAHWSDQAADEFDLHLDRSLALLKVERHELCFNLVDERDDAEAVRSRLLELQMPVWPEGFGGEWWEWYGRWPPVPLEHLTREQREFVQELWSAVRALSYRPDAYEAERTSDRRWFDRKWQRPLEELLAELREQRVEGIRGRYRLTGMDWEKQQGITAADIDAP